MSLWNGGRRSPNDQCDAGYIQSAVKSINDKGVSVRYTYTNMFLDEEDLRDPYCNFCMKTADNGKNEVLVVSPLLEEYVRRNYPGFKINSSTCKEIRDIDEVNEELKKDYTSWCWITISTTALTSWKGSRTKGDARSL